MGREPIHQAQRAFFRPLLTFMLRIPTDTAQPRRFTADEFDRMGEIGIFAEGEHVQLLDGEIIALSPAGDPHAGCFDYLAQELLLHIGRRAQIHVQNPLRLSDRWQPEPDICVLRRRDSFYRDRRPRPEDVLLLVEVAASSLPLDLFDPLELPVGDIVGPRL